MEETGINTSIQGYNYTALETFFSDVSSPQEIIEHLEQLLYFLVYYEHKEGVQGFYNIYSDIFEFKRVLQSIIKTVEAWRSEK